MEKQRLFYQVAELRWSFFHQLSQQVLDWSKVTVTLADRVGSIMIIKIVTKIGSENLINQALRGCH